MMWLETEKIWRQNWRETHWKTNMEISNVRFIHTHTLTHPWCKSTSRVQPKDIAGRYEMTWKQNVFPSTLLIAAVNECVCVWYCLLSSSWWWCATTDTTAAIVSATLCECVFLFIDSVRWHTIEAILADWLLLLWSLCVCISLHSVSTTTFVCVTHTLQSKKNLLHVCAKMYGTAFAYTPQSTLS